jgi:hypothetical protein
VCYSCDLQEGCHKERSQAEERVVYGLRQTEGKDPIPFAAYEYLCHVLNKSKDPQHIAAHLFLTLDRNMLSFVGYNQYEHFFSIFRNTVN